MNDLYQHNLNLGSDLSYFFKKDLLFYVCYKLSMWEMAVEGLNAWDAEKLGSSVSAMVCNHCKKGCLTSAPVVARRTRKKVFKSRILMSCKKKKYLWWFSEWVFSPLQPPCGIWYWNCRARYHPLSLNQMEHLTLKAGWNGRSPRLIPSGPGSTVELALGC